MEGRNFGEPNLLGEQNIEFPRPHSVEELDNTTGREIEGLESRPERFSRLIRDKDYAISQINLDVQCDHDFSEFFLFVNPSNGTETRMVHAPHWRAVVTEDIQSQVRVHRPGGVDAFEPFYQVSTKGVGYLKPTLRDENLEERDTWIKPNDSEGDFGSKMLGLSSEVEFVTNDIIAKSRKFLDEGLRTEAYWAVARLRNVYYKGELTSIEELRRKDVILRRRDYKPHMAVRLLKIDQRIEEARYAEERRSEIFENAFEIFNRETRDKGLSFPELDIKKVEHQKIFFHEYFRRMGQNMAVLLNLGYSHFRLHSSNITLAAEIIDIGTMTHWTEDGDDPVFMKEYSGVRRAHIKDMRDIVRALKKFKMAAKKAGLKVGDNQTLKASFLDGFESKIDVEKVTNKQKTNVANAKKWLDAIFQASIIDGKKLAALLHDGDPDNLQVIENQWGISIE